MKNFKSSRNGQASALQVALAAGIVLAGQLAVAQSGHSITLPPYNPALGHPGYSAPVLILGGIESLQLSSAPASQVPEPVTLVADRGVQTVHVVGPDGGRKQAQLRVQVEQVQPNQAAELQRRQKADDVQPHHRKTAPVPADRARLSFQRTTTESPSSPPRVTAIEGRRSAGHHLPDHHPANAKGRHPDRALLDGPKDWGPAGSGSDAKHSRGSRPAAEGSGPTSLGSRPTPGPVYDGQPWHRSTDAGLEQQIASFDRLMESDTVKRILRLMEENMELRSQLEIRDAQVKAEMEIHEFRIEQMRQDAERSMQEAREMQQRAEQEIREAHDIREHSERELHRAHESRERAGEASKEHEHELNRWRADREKLLNELEERERRARLLEQELRNTESGARKAEEKAREAVAQVLQKLEASVESNAELEHEAQLLRRQLKEMSARLAEANRELASAKLQSRLDSPKREAESKKQEGKKQGQSKKRDKKATVS